jgi:hypothetical protein
LDWAKLAAIRTLILVLAGFTGIAAGAFLIFIPAGWIVSVSRCYSWRT